MTKNIVYAVGDPRNDPLLSGEQREAMGEMWYIPPADLLERPNAHGRLLLVNGRFPSASDVRPGRTDPGGKPTVYSIGTKRLGRKLGSDLARRGNDLRRWRVWLIANDKLTQETLAERLHVQKVTVQRFFRALHPGESGFWDAFCQRGALPPPR
jgi:hypothetical protein